MVRGRWPEVEAVERIDELRESRPSHAGQASALQPRDHALVGSREALQVALRHPKSLSSPPDRGADQQPAAEDAGGRNRLIEGVPWHVGVGVAPSPQLQLNRGFSLVARASEARACRGHSRRKRALAAATRGESARLLRPLGAKARACCGHSWRKRPLAAATRGESARLPRPLVAKARACCGHSWRKRELAAATRGESASLLRLLGAKYAAELHHQPRLASAASRAGSRSW
jgi:hypothetical protein